MQKIIQITQTPKNIYEEGNLRTWAKKSLRSITAKSPVVNSCVVYDEGV